MRAALKYLDVVDRRIGSVCVCAEDAVRVGRVEEPLDAVLDLGAPELRDERIAKVSLGIAEVEVVNFLPAPRLEGCLR